MKNQLTKIVLLTGVLGGATLVGSSQPAKADGIYVAGRGFSLGISNGPTYAPRYYAPRYYAPRYYAPRYYAPRYYAPRYVAPYAYAVPTYYAAPYAYAPAYGAYDFRWHGGGYGYAPRDFRGPVFRDRDFHGGDFRGAPQRHEFGGGR